MSKKLLLASLIGLSCVNMAKATCTAPPDLNCRCQHSIINSEGKLACGEDYCAKMGKKCMPDGSCCESENYCKSSAQGTQCCAEGQDCDTTKGCVEIKADIETLCVNAGGSIVIATSGTFCMSNNNLMTWYDAQEWCSSNGMTMPIMNAICPTWKKNEAGYEECPEIVANVVQTVWTATPAGDDFYFMLIPSDGLTHSYSTIYEFSAICH